MHQMVQICQPLDLNDDADDADAAAAAAAAAADDDDDDDLARRESLAHGAVEACSGDQSEAGSVVDV